MSDVFASLHHLTGSCFRRRARSPWCAAWTLVLVLALLSSQFLGLLHGIVHAGWPITGKQIAHASFSAALFDGDKDSRGNVAHAKHHHSCIEYDAAAGAVGIHVDFIAPPLIPAQQMLTLLQAFVSWDAPVVCPFSTRAPPH